MSDTPADRDAVAAAVAFQQLFGREPQFVAHAPGRVNLIGDHTDYTGGLVLPIAINLGFDVAVGPGEEGRDSVRVHSAHFGETVELPLGDRPALPGDPRWSVYARGVISLLVRQGIELPPASIWIGGDLPLSAGLSSSAACEVGIASALTALAGKELPPLDLARLCRRAENEFAKAPCGIMDQLCCAAARAGHAVRIDCRDLAWEHVPLDLGELAFVVVDSGVRHDIAAGEYAQRRRGVEEALRRLQERDASLVSLRDIELDANGRPRVPGRLDPDLEALVTHVVSENQRVVEASSAAQAGGWPAFGARMDESHASLRDDYRVSCREVDRLVELACGFDGVLGARMTGGGFGGCVIVLMRRDAVDDLAEHLRGHYQLPGGEVPELFAVQACAAARVASP